MLPLFETDFESGVDPSINTWNLWATFDDQTITGNTTHFARVRGINTPEEYEAILREMESDDLS